MDKWRGSVCSLRPFIAREDFWSRRSNREKQIIGCIVLLVFVVLVTLVLCLTVKSVTEVCTKDVCTETAQMFKENIKETVDPCDDFYTFACGNFKQHNKLPGDEYFMNLFIKNWDRVGDVLIDHLSKKAQADEIRPIKYIRQLFNKAIDDTILDKNDFSDIRKVDDELQKTESVVDLISATIKKGLSPLIHIYASKNLTSKVVKIYGPWFYEIRESSLLANESNPSGIKIRDAYYKFISSSLRLYNSKMSQLEADEEARRVLKVQQDFAKLTKTSGKFVYDVNEKTEVPKYIKDIVEVVDELLGEHRNSYDQIIISRVEYFKLLFEASNDTLNDLKHFVTWRMIEEYGWMFSNKFKSEQFNFEKVQYDYKRQERKEAKAFRHLLYSEPFVLGRMYIDAVGFDENEKKVAHELVSSLRPTMSKVIEELEWMDSRTKAATKRLIEKKKFNIGYPEWIMDDAKLTESMDIEFSESDGPFELALRMEKFQLNKRISKLYKNPDHEEHLDGWFSPHWIWPHHNLRQNSISLPAAFLSGALHHPNRPRYTNFAIAGFLISQEIILDLMNIPDEYYENDEPDKLFSNETLSNLKPIVKKMIYQYSSIVDEKTNLTLRGKKTQKKDIADNGAIRIAYQAYFDQGHHEPKLPGFEDWSTEKMFFLSYANTMCEVLTLKYSRLVILNGYNSPSKYRVNVPLSNFEPFSKAFQCKPGSRMNRKNKIRIW